MDALGVILSFLVISNVRIGELINDITLLTFFTRYEKKMAMLNLIDLFRTALIYCYHDYLLYDSIPKFNSYYEYYNACIRVYRHANKFCKSD